MAIIVNRFKTTLRAWQRCGEGGCDVDIAVYMNIVRNILRSVELDGYASSDEQEEGDGTSDEETEEDVYEEGEDEEGEDEDEDEMGMKMRMKMTKRTRRIHVLRNV
eukprot:TRINITY_DN6663_c0_g1_i1.p1 TRINITY_DN6663_c0_g1~~TRINITY_DN6663_c0_g1_i1.p1  ORF type:complete len:106 (-),score=25.47 TRINITY_DN6663_c0_g1_i1:48-365(-)